MLRLQLGKLLYRTMLKAPSRPIPCVTSARLQASFGTIAGPCLQQIAQDLASSHASGKRRETPPLDSPSFSHGGKEASNGQSRARKRPGNCLPSSDRSSQRTSKPCSIHGDNFTELS